MSLPFKSACDRRSLKLREMQRRRKTRMNGGPRHARVPLLEALEQRSLLATFVVTSAADDAGGNPQPGDGTGTLRQAIIDANFDASQGGGAETINFDIAGGGAQTITLITALPNLNCKVNVDGTSQPGYAGTPIISLADGGAAGFGFIAMADGVTIRGFAFESFSADAIELFGSNAVIAGNYIGTDPSAQFAKGSFEGVVIEGSSSNDTIGGSTPADRNVIVNQIFYGIDERSGAGGAVIENNLIGVSPTNVEMANGDGEVLLSGSSNFLGEPGLGNTIAGGEVGVEIDGSSNIMVGNTILGSNVVGLLIGGADNTVGGTGPGYQNAFENNGDGIQVDGASAVGNVIEGNAIGVNPNQASLAFGNSQTGVLIGAGASSNTIGGAAPGAANVISANGGVGLVIQGASTANNSVVGNFIGTDGNGERPFPNGWGVAITSSATDNVISGGNVISGEHEFRRGNQRRGRSGTGLGQFYRRKCGR